MIALVAVCSLTACGTDPQPEAASILAPQGDTDLRSRIEDASDLVVDGERLNAALLQRFYARHDFEPVWTTRPEQADSLVDAVLHAGDQGLNPDLFHADLLQRSETLPPVDRELVLSDAFLSYADALARGAVPVERRGDDEVLTPGPVNVAAVLDDAMDSSDPAAEIEALAPTTPTYTALLDALRKYRAAAAAGNKVAKGRVRTIEVNLERQRWLPRSLPEDRVWVNVADQRLVLYRDDQPVFSTRVVVGEDVKHNQSPEFRATIDASFFNPPWVIPKDIVTAEILPAISRDPNYLVRNNMVMLPSGEAEQLPGPDAGLGQIMFDMPNRFDVYLHDTPDKYIFNRDNRRISHGCIRVQDPREFAALLMQQPKDEIDEGIAAGGTTRHDLPTPVPVFVVYQTAFVDADGKLQFRPDFYDRDAGIWRKLQKPSLGKEPTVQADNRPGPSGGPHGGPVL
ncbi:MAG TPA: L,D-transpeptidase family protein [Rhodopila sp.]|uniref:L,D-transpeptidase family protein n=1 Tax=Rhodopila sp. TaxID=2480087 RepID=UPI002C27ECA3|nr:L,D-transpeptidase family protein [Rhodopila sp.]HVY16986.1 L,D-transpeptidase family protein [Rhodopila sp.]